MEIKEIMYQAEANAARLERTIARLWTLLILMLLVLVGSNMAWIYYENQFEDVVTIEQESSTEGGGNAIVNNGGDVNYGTSETDSN